MKTLNDTLREEFQNIFQDEKYSKKIKSQNLDLEIIKKSFDVLLKYKAKSDLSDKARSEFENFLINYFRTIK